MNALVQQNLADLAVNPEYTQDHLNALKTELFAHIKTRDYLEYFLFARANQIRKQASLTADTEAKLALHHQADAVLDILYLLFGSIHLNLKSDNNIRV